MFSLPFFPREIKKIGLMNTCHANIDKLINNLLTQKLTEATEAKERERLNGEAIRLRTAAHRGLGKLFDCQSTNNQMKDFEWNAFARQLLHLLENSLTNQFVPETQFANFRMFQHSKLHSTKGIKKPKQSKKGRQIIKANVCGLIHWPTPKVPKKEE